MRRTTSLAATVLLALAALQAQGRAVADGTPVAAGPGTPAVSVGLSAGPPGSAPTAASGSASGGVAAGRMSGATSDTPARWQVEGKPLSGAAGAPDAPAMDPTVTYQDTIGPGETKFYGVALDARSSAYVSAFAVPVPRTRVGYGDGLDLRLTRADGAACDSRTAHFQDNGDARPIGTAVSRLIGVGTSCQEAGRYTLRVRRASGATSDPDGWPLELRYVAEPPLVAGATVPPALPTGTAPPVPLTAGTPRQARGGTGFETAAAVRTGIWKDKVLPGETRFYKVPVDWGQQATVFADFADAQATGVSAFVGSGVRLSVFSPVREYVDGEERSYLGTPTSVAERLAPVSYANRAADDNRVARVRYAGWYYLAVSVHPKVAEVVSGALPVTLRIEVTGAAQAAPPYDGDPGAAGIGVSAHDAASAGGTAAEAGGGAAGGGAPARPLRVVAFAAFGAGTALLLVLAGWSGYGYAAGRRRSGRGRGAADAAPPGAA
ncbi:hypothetical protein [Actinacidiphila sp. ITFR-21]|uniref:hypothetical protein n=1 Tax=Actinacidiphila sp. ITFR-21 TaxID=3075199 RepID=UPI0028894CF8|nr:hypothetical protein [Streptomyces sp. ITFR-21]WNI16680.1 hypothetical protein RLT57_14925 [Streptomyces sp. ITFR-21]